MNWICLDCETGDAPPEAIEAAIRAWKPPSNWKPETKETKRQEAAERFRKNAALLDASPILCVGVMTSAGDQIMFSGMPVPVADIAGWQVLNAGSESLMLLALREWLNTASFTEEPTLVGANLRGFDLPKLRLAYLRSGLRLPELFRPRMDGEQPVRQIDVNQLIKSFSTQYRDEFLIRLNLTAAILGINLPKQIVNGADVPDMYRQGQYQAISVYCAIDCATTARAFLLMTGQASDLA